jgi:site-specific DNA-methyltransferase (adenine-specific)
MIENGRYRLYQGDCLEVMDGLISLGVKFDAIITDPPYGKITKTCEWDKIIPFDEMWKRLNKLKKKNTPIILFGNQPFTSALNMSNLKDFRYEIIWQKDKGTDFGNANRKPLNIHENISVFYEKQPNYNRICDEGNPYIRKNNRTNGKNDTNFKSDNSGTWINEGKRTPTTIRKINRVSAGGKKPLHPTEKPIELMEWIIKSYTNENDLVLDFTMGSGSTGVACMNTNRRFVGIELDENYFNIAKDRIENIS